MKAFHDTSEITPYISTQMTVICENNVDGWESEFNKSKDKESDLSLKVRNVYELTKLIIILRYVLFKISWPFDEDFRTVWSQAAKKTSGKSESPSLPRETD